MPLGGRNKDKFDGNKKAKERLKKQTEASSLSEKIDHMVHSNDMMAKTLEAKMLLAEKKAQEKQEKWQILRNESLPRRTSPWPNSLPRRTR